MKVKVVKGSIVYKGNEFAVGETFECDKEVANSLLVANLVELVVDSTQEKKSTKKSKEK